MLGFDGDGYSVVNAGNVGLKVDVYNGTELIEKIKVGASESALVDGDKFAGGQDE